LTSSVTLRGVAYTPEEPTFSLSSMAQPKKRRAGLIAAAIAVGVLVVGIGAGGIGYALATRGKAAPAAIAGPSSAAAAPATTPTATVETSAAAACRELAYYSRTVTNDAYAPSDLPALKTIAERAAASDSFTVSTSGQLLSGTVDLAVAAQGRADGAKYLAEVPDAVRHLRKQCATAGYQT
jgi:hypothetical protein